MTLRDYLPTLGPSRFSSMSSIQVESSWKCSRVRTHSRHVHLYAVSSSGRYTFKARTLGPRTEITPYGLCHGLDFWLCPADSSCGNRISTHWLILYSWLEAPLYYTFISTWSILNIKCSTFLGNTYAQGKLLLIIIQVHRLGRGQWQQGSLSGWSAVKHKVKRRMASHLSIHEVHCDMPTAILIWICSSGHQTPVRACESWSTVCSWSAPQGHLTQGGKQWYWVYVFQEAWKHSALHEIPG